SFFFFSSRRRHTRFSRDWSSDVCSSDLIGAELTPLKKNYGALEDRKISKATAEKFGVWREGDTTYFPYFNDGKHLANKVRLPDRSEERRVGKECRSQWQTEQYKGQYAGR